MAEILREPFGTTAGGETVARYTLRNGSGMSVSVLTYGAVIQSVLVPDREGALRDVVLGYDSLADYEEGTASFGAFVGRYANRIKDSYFVLDGWEYKLQPNRGPHHLHGTFARRVFQAEEQGGALALFYESPDGEDGFPGTLHVAIRYELTEDNGLSMIYRVETDSTTVLNLTNHSYFNLNGQDGSTVEDQWLELASDAFTPSDSDAIPTGEIRSVEGTPMDLRQAAPLGRGIRSKDPLLSVFGGFDHNYVLPGDGALRPFARAWSEESGIVLEAETTQPGVQLYTANGLSADKGPAGKGGVRYPRYGGFCLETQHYPCSPNYPQFPSTVLQPWEIFWQQTVYRFSVKK